MITTEKAREITRSFVDGLQRQDIDALLDLCAETIVWSGILVKKVTGEPSGILRGKVAVRSLAEQLFRTGGGFSPSLNRMAVGVGSIVLDLTMEGLIPIFGVLVIDAEGRIAQVAMHQEVL